MTKFVDIPVFSDSFAERKPFKGHHGDPDFKQGVEIRQRIINHAVILGRDSVRTYDKLAAVDDIKDSKAAPIHDAANVYLQATPGQPPKTAESLINMSQAEPAMFELRPPAPATPTAQTDPGAFRLDAARRNVIASRIASETIEHTQAESSEAMVVSLNEARAAKLVTEDTETDELETRFREMGWNKPEEMSNAA